MVVFLSKNVDGVFLQSFFSAHCLIMIYVCTKFCETVSKDFRVIEQILFSKLTFFKEA